MAVPPLPLPTPGQNDWAGPLNDSLEILNQGIGDVNDAATAAENARDEAVLAAQAAEAVGDTNDAIMTSVAQDPGSAFSAELTGQIDAAVPDNLVQSAEVSGISVPGITGRHEVQFTLQPPETYFTDFTSETVGDPPVGWVPVGAATRLWGVQTTAGATGGVALVSSGSSGGSLINPLFEQMMAGHVDCEMAFKWTQGSANGAIRSVMLASDPNEPSGTAPGFANAITATHINGTSLGFREYVSGDVATIGGSVPFTSETGTWYVAVVRKVGTWFYGKQWKHSDPEPTEWTISAGTPRLWDGAFGLSSIGGNTQRVDWVGFAVGGASAPRGL